MDGNNMNKYKCPCCDYYTLNEKANNTFQICPVCYWEDDGVQLDYPTYEGGANQMSLNDARKNFQTNIEAEKFKEYIRNIEEDEKRFVPNVKFSHIVNFPSEIFSSRRLMICRLCLSELEESTSVKIFEDNGSEFEVSKVIAKYLHLQLANEDNISNKICCKCWINLDGFHKFCLLVEEKQSKLQQQYNEMHSFAQTDNFSHLKVEQLQTEDVPSHNLIKSTPNNDENGDDSFESDGEDNDMGLKGDEVYTSEDEILANIKTICQEENISKNAHTSQDGTKLIGKKRGRPRKGEEKPKVKKPKSEKHSEYYRISREFDEIIAKNMKLECNLCLNALENFGELKRHFRSIHKCRGYAVCCNKRLYKKSLVVDHINTHLNPEYFKCRECNKVLADRMCLRNHTLSMHQSEQDKIFKCKDCPRKFAKQYLLDNHKVMHATQSERTFICDTCGKGFPTKSTLNMHINVLHANAYSKMCEICAKVIRGMKAFEKHQLAHAGIVEPSVQCELCGSWLKDRNSLRKHMYRHKEDSKGGDNICTICGKVAPSKNALSSHYRYVHTTERSHKCTICEKAFKRPKALKEHMATHTGEMLYSCPHCPRTFKSSANMHSHRKKSHRIEWNAARAPKFVSVREIQNQSIL